MFAYFHGNFSNVSVNGCFSWFTDSNAVGMVPDQKEWKKSKLVDDLNDKLASRPGVFELVKRNIIPGSKNLQEAIKGTLLEKD